MASTKTQTNFETEVDYISKVDTGDVSALARTQFIADALVDFSKDKGREVMKDITGDGTFTYNVPTSPAWIEGLSRMIAPIENYASTNQSPNYLQDEDWEFYRTSATQLAIRLKTWTPNSSETIRLRYTTLHAIGATAADTTVEDIDFHIVSTRAAMYVCRAAANKYAKIADSTLGADAVEYGVKSSNYAARADELEELYNRLVGKTAEGITSGGVRVNWNTKMSDLSDWLIHRRWRR